MEVIVIGRGKHNTCENYINYDERREICRLDKSNVEKDDWCKHHKGEDED